MYVFEPGTNNTGIAAANGVHLTGLPGAEEITQFRES